MLNLYHPTNAMSMPTLPHQNVRQMQHHQRGFNG
jgi:hypothetical protein